MLTPFNSIRPVNFLLLLTLFILSGCAEKNTSHVAIDTSPPSIDPIINTKVIDYEALKKENCPIVSSPLSPIHETVWERLFSLYALPDIDNARIDQEINNYLQQPEFLRIVQQRAEPYLYFILNEIETNQLPGEFALLPAVESGFRPTAVSSSKASGLWQFMPATGRLFGLKQNWWYDGRNDVCTSTQAATAYLKQLSKQFDDNWLLALAAYNAGRGTIRKAIRKNNNNDLKTGYWSLYLSKETMDYVPRLLALAKIFANADKYNISLQKIPNKPYFTVVNIDSQLDLHLASEMAETPINDFFKLNAGFKRTSTDPDGPYHLLVHADKAETFKNSLAHTSKENRMKWLRHKIKAGENLGILAKRHNTSVNALRQSNHLVNNNIQAGKFLLIPSTSSKLTETKTTTQKKHLYIVKKGDTIWNIARQFDVSSKDLAFWNNLSLSNALYPGQKLLINKS